MEWGTPVKLGFRGGLSWPIFKFREIPIPRGDAVLMKFFSTELPNFNNVST